MRPDYFTHVLNFCLIITLSLSGCEGKEKQAHLIKGSCAGYKGSTITLVRLGESGEIPMDSVKVSDDGSFSLKFSAPEPSFFRLKMSDKSQFLLFLDSLESPEVSFNNPLVPSEIKIKGSALSDELAKTVAQLQEKAADIEKLNQTFAQSQNSPKIDSIRKALEKQYYSIKEGELNLLKNFIHKNGQSPVCLALIDKVSPDEHIEIWQELDASLQKGFANHAHVKPFHQRVMQLSKLAVGGIAPDIQMKDPEGNLHSLAEFRGKVLLIDFWASWCRPCRQENPNVVRMYKNFHDKGFEIMGVSLDNNKDNWIKAIKDDGLVWTQVSDLGYWNSAAVKLYNISGIPFTCLLDKEGKIVAKGLRGEDLEKKIASLIEEK